MKPKGVLPKTWEKLLELRNSRMRIESLLKDEECVLHSMKQQEQRLAEEISCCEQNAQEAVDKVMSNSFCADMKKKDYDADSRSEAAEKELSVRS